MRRALMPRSATSARRAGGAPALAELDSPAALDSLTTALADPDPEARAAAGLALASLRDPASIPALARIVASWADPALARCRHAALCIVEQKEPVTLEFLMRDYVRHLKHHLDQIFA